MASVLSNARGLSSGRQGLPNARQASTATRYSILPPDLAESRLAFAVGWGRIEDADAEGGGKAMHFSSTHPFCSQFV